MPQGVKLEQALEQAVGLHQSGRLAEAQNIYGQILGADPSHFTARHMLGIVHLQMGRTIEAITVIGDALKIRPDDHRALSNYALALQASGRFREALENFDRALSLDPHNADALNNRGNLMWNMGRGADAIANFDAALVVRPNHVSALNNRGAVLRSMKRLDEALASIDAALELRPNFPDAHHNRGTVLMDMRRLEEALACYDTALALNPEYAEALENRGAALRELKRPEDALESYDKALALKPDFARALYKRGNMLWTEYRHYEPAVGDLEKAVLADPDHEYARGDLLHLRMYGGDWRDYEHELALVDAGVRAGRRVVGPFTYQGVSESPADLQVCSKIYADHHYPAALALWSGQDRHHDKIRVGYVSGEFREQVVAYLTAGLYELHDKERFEIIAFDNGWNDEGPTRKRLESAFDEFIDISKLSDRAAAEKIAAKQINILVNLNGYFGLQRMGVFAHRPAPVQVNYLGFPGTLGAPYIDYILADRFVIPEDERRYYDEQVVYLPDTYQVNDSKREVAQTIPSRAENGLPEKAIVFCNFNQSYKLTPAIFALWMRILNEVEGSVLWMPENNQQFRENLRREAARSGVSEDRLIFAPHVPLGQHLARLTLADLFLDSLPYNAHTTASDALWAGLPLLTCRGKSFAGRVAASQLHAIGLPELVTENLEAYEALALALAGDPALLRSMREKLSRNRLTTPLFDTDRFRRHLESAYTTMWERHTRGEPPKGFHVAPS